MFDAGRRPLVRLFYLGLTVISTLNMGQRCGGVAPGSATTTVSDTVYLADGSAARGSLIITWPAFVTASGTAVAAGTTNVALGSNGVLNVALMPNAGATPAGVYYTVVYQLGPGQVKTEFWMVPTASPATLATVRTTPGSGLAGQPVSMQYVNSALATKANDDAVVHVSGTETIAGTKTFSSSPNVPAPSSAADIATKGYVDEAVTTVGAGSFVPTAGGTMTGPLSLSTNPVSGLHATPKQYVDSGLSTKADLISGRVPAGELGTGTASSSTCLLGNGTWGSCASGGGSGNVNSSGTPGGSQVAVWTDATHIQGQAKAALDVRDYGVDCSGATDSSAALNALFSGISNRVVDFPQTCQIRADHQVVIFGQYGFVLRGMGDRPGVGGFNGPALFGCNGSAGAVLYVNRSGYGRIEGLGIYPKGPSGVCSSSNFTGSIQIDNSGTGGVTGHQIILDHMALTTSPLGGALSGYTGLAITSGGLSNNNEQIVLKNSWVHCQNSPNSYGIDLEAGASDNDKAENNDFSSCYQGIHHGYGNMRIIGNMFTANGNYSVFGANGAAIFLGQCASGPVSILYNEETDGGQFINSANDAGGGLGCTGGVNVIGNDIGISDYDVANTYPVNLGTTAAAYLVEGNQIHLNQVPTTHVIGSKSQGTYGPLGTMYEWGNTLQNTNGTALGICCQTPGFQAGEVHMGTSQYAHSNSPLRTSSMDDLSFSGLFKNGFASPLKIFRSNGGQGGTGNDDWTIQNVASRPSQTSSLIVKHTQGATGNLFVGIDGSFSGLSVAQVAAPDAPIIGPIGGSGSTSYTYAIVAYTSGGGTAAGPTASMATGVSSLSASQYNQILFSGTAGALQYCIWRTAGGGSTGSIGCIPAIAFSNTASGYSVNTVNGGGLQYLWKDTGQAGDGTALPTLNTTGQLVVKGGPVTLPITGPGSQCLHVNSIGVVSGTGSDCGSGGGSGSGTVNSGTASHVAIYSANGTAVSGDTALTDDGATLSYAGTGGISAATASFSGNVTVNGELQVAGPWLVSSVPPSSGMGAAASGDSAIGISNDGNFYVSANGGAPSQIVTATAPTLSSATLTGTTTVSGPLSGSSANFSGNVTVGGQIIGTGPWSVSGPVPGVGITPMAGTSQAAFDTNGLFTLSENGGAALQVAKVNSNITGTAANLSGTPALPNGTMATTQAAHDNSTKLATTSYVDAAISGMSTSWMMPISASNSGAFPSSSANRCLLWGFTLPVAVQTSQISYFVGANADNSGTYNYDLGVFNSSGSLVLNLSGGSLHGSTFAAATGATTLSWTQGSTLLLPGAYYLAYYSSNTTTTPPTLYGSAGNAPVFYKAESGSSGAQGSNGFSITPRSGGILPSSVSPPAANGPQASYMPMFWLH
jgi:hypothetical protein